MMATEIVAWCDVDLDADPDNYVRGQTRRYDLGDGELVEMDLCATHDDELFGAARKFAAQYARSVRAEERRVKKHRRRLAAAADAAASDSKPRDYTTSTRPGVRKDNDGTYLCPFNPDHVGTEGGTCAMGPFRGRQLFRVHLKTYHQTRLADMEDQFGDLMTDDPKLIRAAVKFKCRTAGCDHPGFWGEESRKMHERSHVAERTRALAS